MALEDSLNGGFHYLVAQNKPLLIVTFIGDMDRSAVESLLSCRRDIAAAEDIRFVIFNFRDVSSVSGEAITSFTQMQVEIRTRGCELRISSMSPALREQLLRMGVIRSSELSNNLREALLSMVHTIKGRSAA